MWMQKNEWHIYHTFRVSSPPHHCSGANSPMLPRQGVEPVRVGQVLHSPQPSTWTQATAWTEDVTRPLAMTWATDISPNPAVAGPETQPRPSVAAQAGHLHGLRWPQRLLTQSVSHHPHLCGSASAHSAQSVPLLSLVHLSAMFSHRIDIHPAWASLHCYSQGRLDIFCSMGTTKLLWCLLLLHLEALEGPGSSPLCWYSPSWQDSHGSKYSRSPCITIRRSGD